jgi:hypothetical protein
MSTVRVVLYTDSHGSLMGLPKFPPNKKVEVVFRIIDPAEAPVHPRRFPNPEIAGRVEIMGNILVA